MNAELKVIAPAWKALQQAAKLGPITSKAHYAEMLRLSEFLIDEIGANHAHPLNNLLYIVGDLIRAYDESHVAIPDTSPAEVVAFLMEQHGLKQADLAAEIGSQGIVSEVLRGKREINARQAKALAKRFEVSVAVFL